MNITSDIFYATKRIDYFISYGNTQTTSLGAKTTLAKDLLMLLFYLGENNDFVIFLSYLRRATSLS